LVGPGIEALSLFSMPGSTLFSVPILKNSFKNTYGEIKIYRVLFFDEAHSTYPQVGDLFFILPGSGA
jgi:hypothetical protein